MVTAIDVIPIAILEMAPTSSFLVLDDMETCGILYFILRTAILTKIGQSISIWD